jgi:hypothetical protein
MQFNGYTFQTLLPGLAIIALVIAVLYLLRVRRRSVAVPYIGLWREVLEKSSHRRWHDWVKRIVSYLLIMGVVGLIALALMDPRQEEDDSARRHAVIIVDASASMTADAQKPDSDCKTRFECAVEDAQKLIDNMGMTDRAVIVEASGMVSAVSGPFSADKSALSRALQTIQPRSTTTDMGKALELAVNLTQERANAEIFLLTDGQIKDAESLSQMLPSNVAFEQKTYGEASGNLSIEAFNVRRYIANRLGFEVFFKVHNGFDKPVTARLKIFGLEDKEMTFNPQGEHPILAEKTLTIASGDSELRLYDNLTIGSSRMAATIEIVDPADLRDPMPMDDIAYARIPDYAKPRILCISSGNLYLEAALLLNENYRVEFVSPDKAVRNAQGIELKIVAADYDIVILDNSYRNLGNVDTADWQGRTIFINPDATYSPFKTTEVVSPVIERVNNKHAVARWLSLKNLNIARANTFSGIKNDELIMRAIEGPLMATRKTDDQRMVAVGFSLVESDLIFRVGLPVFFINAVDWLMDENTEPQRGFPTGQAWHVTVPDTMKRVDITKPDGSKLQNLPAYDNAVSLYGETAGFYQIAPHESPKTARNIEFAANFYHPDESNLSQKPSEITGRIHLKTTLGDAIEPNEEESSLILSMLEKLPSSSQYVWVLALLIAMGLITVEWLTYHRRWTV